ncbi:ABC transporter substrate-binding protein [Arthrobacter sp. AL08]|uniref:ABC transporter substrate-binding protein n=1 Tax=unclassified Arthrobacter TaxID=235627 RepID=UPI00249BF8AA|nr:MULTISPECIES: ABC transporter substrate-binding protein [unclassified Arthrobacter]MDI3240019.1 ABC transporter substrate-binding protein [Arthrobacter sp. AL05]MDI3276029.1 ABC transporter substrate-binding protein [Arthrobacter sp. AL08]
MQISRSLLSNPALKAATVLAVSALALTACTNASETGTTGGPSASGSAKESFDPTTVKKDDALAAMVPEAIKSKGTLTVGSDTTYAPAEFLGNDGQTAVGYDVDIAKAIGATLGLKVQVQTSEFTGILPALGPKYDLGISSFTINPERLGAVNMVSYFNAGTAWAVQKGNPKKVSLDDLCGKSVGVQTGTVQEDPDLSDRNKKCAADGKQPINVVTLKNQTDITTRLVNGSVDAMAADSPITGYAVTQTNGQIEKIGDVYDAAPQGIAVAKSDMALAEVIQKTVAQLIENGSYKKILEGWGNAEGAITKSEVNPAAGS